MLPKTRQVSKAAQQPLVFTVVATCIGQVEIVLQCFQHNGLAHLEWSETTHQHLWKVCYPLKFVRQADALEGSDEQTTRSDDNTKHHNMLCTHGSQLTQHAVCRSQKADSRVLATCKVRG